MYLLYEVLGFCSGVAEISVFLGCETDYIVTRRPLPGWETEISVLPECGTDYIVTRRPLPGWETEISVLLECGTDYIVTRRSLPGWEAEISVLLRCETDYIVTRRPLPEERKTKCPLLKKTNTVKKESFSQYMRSNLLYYKVDLYLCTKNQDSSNVAG